MGRKTEVQETVHKDFNFCQPIFAPVTSGVFKGGEQGTCLAPPYWGPSIEVLCT